MLTPRPGLLFVLCYKKCLTRALSANNHTTIENEVDNDNSADALLPPGPWLVFARRPGEEVRALDGSLMRARSNGIAVAIVYTDSASASFGDFLTEIRRVFLAGTKDSGNEVRSLAALVRKIAPATVFIPSRFDEDPDLRALSVAVRENGCPGR